MSSKILVLITGANTGLGFEIAKTLFERCEPYHILIGCRGDISRASEAISKLKKLSPCSKSTAEPLAIDITSDLSIASAFKIVEERFGYVDVLVNNAGVDMDIAATSGRITKREAWNETWNVNVTGTHLFTEAFAPLLLISKSGGPRLIFITSGLSSIQEHSNGSSPKYNVAPAGWPKPSSYYLAYRSSKTALNMLAAEWGRLLHNDEVKVFNISPGFLNTGLSDDRITGELKDKAALGAIDPAIGGAFCADVIEGKRDEQAWPTKALRKDTIQPW